MERRERGAEGLEVWIMDRSERDGMGREARERAWEG